VGNVSQPHSVERVSRRRDLVVFVHPPGNPEVDVVPLGLVGIMNAVPEPKIGLFAAELREDLLRRAAVVLIDLHWYHNLAPALSLCRVVRRFAPQVPIVAGGYTATVLCGPLMDSAALDYIVWGDAEGPTLALVEALREGHSVQGIPNVVGREQKGVSGYHLTRAEFDRFDYTSLAWFPALHARVRSQHEAHQRNTKYPVVVTYKGCRPPVENPTAYCRNCYGQPSVQRQLFGRNLVSRSPEKVRADLRRLSDDAAIRRVFIFDDFISCLGEEYARQVLTETFHLGVYLEPYGFLSSDIVRLLARCFDTVELVFYHDDLGDSLEQDDDQARAFVSAAREHSVTVTLCVVRPASPRLIERAAAAGFRLVNNQSETFTLPDPFASEQAAVEELKEFLSRSRRFSVLKLMADLAPIYLDAIAVQLGLVEFSGGELRSMLSGPTRGERPNIDDNPVERHILSGANPLDLVFFAAPFTAVSAGPLSPFARIPRSHLLASPVCIESFDAELESGWFGWGFSIAFDVVRSGRLVGLAINFVSEQSARMRHLRYDSLWKLCLPVGGDHTLQRGDRIRLRATLQTHLDPPLDLRLELVSEK